jgi:hypothetical protein
MDEPAGGLLEEDVVPPETIPAPNFNFSENPQIPF